MKTTLTLLLATVSGIASSFAAPDAAKTPTPRNVPALLKTFGGETIKTSGDWESRRAPEILDVYRREVFGVRPQQLEDRSRISFRTLDERDAFGGRAVRKIVEVKYAGDKGDFRFPFTAFIPKSDRKVPAFVYIGLNIKTSVAADGEFKSYRWPVEEITSRGYAAVGFCNANVAADAKVGFDQGIFAAVESADARGSSSWGTISAWAWGASRLMDWIETETAIDSSHVGVVGHSRGGKTAIWAGVNDRRFAMVCSNDSGCSGAKLNHIDLPRSESIAKIIKGFPYWFCGNYAKHAGKEMEMPFDQHELLALVAPRLLCVASATHDRWAGPEGEWWSAKLASPAWELYGKKGLVADAMPAPNSPQQDGCVSYHLRAGGHELSSYDWKCYMDAADRHGWRR